MSIENFLIYPRSDPQSRLTIITDRITFTGLLDNDNDTYCYRDFGAAYFPSDFLFNCTLKITDSTKNASFAITWALTNIVGDYQDIVDASGDGLFVYNDHPNSPDEHQINIREVDGGVEYPGNGGTDYALTVGTIYYLTISRDEAVGTYGTIYLKIYSDSARTTLLTTLSLALHTSMKNYRYLYGIQSRWNLSTSKAMSGYVEDLELVSNSLTPVVTTQSITDVLATTATGNGTIVSIGGASVTEHGHCWAITINPTTADSKTTNGAGSVGTFTSAITGLTPGTYYYERAYATNSYGTSYGANVYFQSGGAAGGGEGGTPSGQRLPGEIWIEGNDFKYMTLSGVTKTLTGA